MDGSGMDAIEENNDTNKSFQVKVLHLLLEGNLTSKFR